MPSFYCVVARTEPIFRLEDLLRSLDDSHPDKAYLLSLIYLARVQFNLLNGTLDFSDIDFLAQSWRNQLLEILESRRYVRPSTTWGESSFNE